MPADRDVADAVLASAWPALSAQVREAHPSVFAPEVAVAAARPSVDRLVGFLARDPDWVSA
jgi:hypothetical protein